MSKSVTVIVPIYNVEKYVRTCFESLLSQTSDDFEVLAVNDGSTDGSETIIKEYVENNRSLIKGIKKENGGYGSVLQLAIKECTTPYILICDPDDSLKPGAIATLLSLAQTANADITIGAKTLVYEDSIEEKYDASYNQSYVALKTNTVYTRQKEAFDDLFFVDPSPHAKLYKTSLASGIHFPEKVGYTDNLLFFLSLLKATRVVYTDQPLANYLINRKGNSVQDVSYKAMNGEIRVFKTLLTQAGYIENVPDIFWYRMFETFKTLLYKTRRVNVTRQDKEEILDYLETFLTKLTAKETRIKPYYKKYAKTEILERYRDYAFMNAKKEPRAYASCKKRMLKEAGARI